MFRLIGSSVAYKSHALIFNSHATHCKPKIHIDKGSKIFTKVGSTCLKKKTDLDRPGKSQRGQDKTPWGKKKFTIVRKHGASKLHVRQTYREKTKN